jgi:hypothetical protein
MLFSWVVFMLALLALVVGLVVFALPVIDERYYNDKKYLMNAGYVSSVVATVWLFVPILVWEGREVFALMALVSLVFFYLTCRFHRMATKIK